MAWAATMLFFSPEAAPLGSMRRNYGVDKGVLSYLMPRAIDAGNKRAASFDGWAVITRRELVKPRHGAIPIEVFPSPIDAVGFDGNAYHAHALRPEDLGNYYYALQLKWLFETFGQRRPALPSRKPVLERMSDWLKSKLDFGP